MRLIENKSIDEIVEFFIRLNKWASHSTHLEVQQALEQGIQGYNAKDYRIGIDRLTRARKHNKKPILHSVNEILAPHPKHVNNLGRFNITSESVFYCSTEPVTSLKELNPEKGDIITLLEFGLKSKLDNLLFIGHKILAQNPLLTDILDNFYQNRNVNQKQIEMTEIIDEIFSIHCYSQTMESYKILKAYWELGKKHMVANGIIYPSFHNSLRAANLVIKPDYLHPLIKPIRFYIIKIIESRFDHFFDYVLTHKGKLKSNKDIITWKAVRKKVKHVSDVPVELYKYIDPIKFNNPKFFKGEIPWIEKL